MIKPAFSTVACPEWPLETVFETAARSGFPSVELRTFGDASRWFACDPALTAPEKIRGYADRFGVNVCMLATGARFDAPINPPVIGHVIADQEEGVREAKRSIDLAASIECPLVRVFAFEKPSTEKLSSAIQRIAERILKVADHADRTGVKVVLENGGTFTKAADIAAILDEVGSPLIGACYNVSVAHAAGENPQAGINVLGDKLWAARVKDHKAGIPCPLGEGDVPVRAAFERLVKIGFDGPVVFEHDRAWIPNLQPAQIALPAAAQTMFGWIGGPSHAHAFGRGAAAVSH